MDSGSVLLAVVVVAIVSFLYWLYSFAIAPFKVLSRVGIQGPPPVPFYGNYKIVIKLGRLKYFTKMFEKYGNVFGYYLGQQPIVAIKDLDILKEVTVKQFELFCDRPYTPDLLRSKSGTPRGLFNARGADWKRIRVTLTPTFSASKMKVMATLMVDRCTTLQTILAEYADTNKSLNVLEVFGKLTMETVIAAAFGRIIDIQRGNSNELVEAANVIFSVVNEGQQLSRERLELMLSNCPCVIHILRFFASRSKGGDAYKKLSKLVLELIKARRESTDAQNYKDLLQLMLDATTEDKGEQRRLTNLEVLSQSFAFVAAAFETTANLLTYTAYLLAMNPDIQDKLMDEIKKSLSEHPDMSPYDIAQEIQYLDMVIQEALRIYPPAPFTLRYCNETTTIGQLRIPKGANVVVPIWHIHHDPQYWPDPDKFDPNRFTKEEKEEMEKRPSMAHMPFGWGPRNCIGMRFALMEVKLAFISILSKYKFVRAPETEDPLQVRIGITMTPKNGVFLQVASHQSP